MDSGSYRGAALTVGLSIWGTFVAACGLLTYCAPPQHPAVVTKCAADTSMVALDQPKPKKVWM